MSATMRAARVHEYGQPMRIDELPVPPLRLGHARVKVHAVNIVPNLSNVLSEYPKLGVGMPTLPAIFGLDAAGVIDAVDEDVEDFAVGDRVYVNPLRRCGSCRACRSDDSLNCVSWSLAGYFGSTKMLDRYSGGFAEYMVAPGYSLVKLPESLSFNAAARFGYLGTVYAAMAKAIDGPGKTMLVSGVTGTLGIGGALLASAFGVTEVFGTGRNRELLQKLAVATGGRVQVHSLDDGPADAWIRERTGGRGVDVVIEALGAGAPAESFMEAYRCLTRGGLLVNVGGCDEPVPVFARSLYWQGLVGSAWFTSGQAQAMADLCGSGALDLSLLEHRVFPLSRVNEVIAGVGDRKGGFTNFIIDPQDPA